MKKNTKMSVGKKVAIGAGVAALGAAGVGAYYLLGSKNAKANQKKVKVLANKVKKELKKDFKKVEKEAKNDVRKAKVVGKAVSKKVKKTVATTKAKIAKRIK